MEGVESAGSRWKMVAVLALLAGAAWWVWGRQSPARPAVAERPNAPAPSLPPAPGLSATLLSKMERCADTQIPVVMTSGSSVPWGEDEVRLVIQHALNRLNEMDEQVTFLQRVSVSKTVDAFKTVAYDIVTHVYDARQNVGLMVSLSALVPVSGRLYVRSLRLSNSQADTGPPGAGGTPADGEFAAYEDPVAQLRAEGVARGSPT